MPIALITMTGAKSSRTLTRPLCYAVDGDRVVITESYGGAPKNPPWYYDLIKNPVVTVDVDTEKYQARAVTSPGPSASGFSTRWRSNCQLLWIGRS